VTDPADELWRYHVLASCLAITGAWPPAARGAFHDHVMAAPTSWRPDGDDDAERAAGARALARAWFAAWKLGEQIRTATPVPRGPAPVADLAAIAPSLPPLSAAELDELAALWRLLGRDLALAAVFGKLDLHQPEPR
jgi:hypothetical protein